ncbi:MAG: class I SAM-dependent methyltransferase [Isosphaeraceae bacterium]
MSAFRVPPAWQLPEGVDAPLWQYTHTPRLAAEEDAYFSDHPLFRADARLLDERFTTPGRLVDLGCGAGRHALRFAGRGFTVAAVDLSHPMLEIVGRKAASEGSDLLRVEANLCRLTCFPNGGFDYALSMFSTLGMIRGAGARGRALAEFARILRPGGRLALHAHNIWLNLRDRQGRTWLLRHAVRTVLRRDELGERRMTYRGIPGMRVHLYRWGELRRSLHRAGFRIDEVIPLDEVTAEPIRRPGFLHSLRAGGWIVFATRV